MSNNEQASEAATEAEAPPAAVPDADAAAAAAADAAATATATAADDNDNDDNDNDDTEKEQKKKKKKKKKQKNEKQPTEKIKWARQQVEKGHAKKYQREEGQNEYNVWYGTYDSFDKGPREVSLTMVDIKRDSGRTRAKTGQPICIHFARGMCMHGRECRYLHRLPTAEDRAVMDITHDVFGRARHRTHKDDMSGVGSFDTDGTQLWVAGFDVSDAEAAYRKLHKAFSRFGEIDLIEVKPKYGCAFIAFEHRANAEFAKAALLDQRLLGDPNTLLKVAWARPDPNPRKIALIKRRRQQRLLEAMVAAGHVVEQDADGNIIGQQGGGDDDDGEDGHQHKRQRTQQQGQQQQQQQQQQPQEQQQSLPPGLGAAALTPEQRQYYHQYYQYYYQWTPQQTDAWLAQHYQQQQQQQPAKPSVQSMLGYLKGADDDDDDNANDKQQQAQASAEDGYQGDGPQVPMSRTQQAAAEQAAQTKKREDAMSALLDSIDSRQ